MPFKLYINLSNSVMLFWFCSHMVEEKFECKRIIINSWYNAMPPQVIRAINSGKELGNLLESITHVLSSTRLLLHVIIQCKQYHACIFQKQENINQPNFHNDSYFRKLETFTVTYSFL